MILADRLKGDLMGGATAAIVALPLALAFGVASGAGPLAGLYGAICVGFFASIFGGTAMQVSGPTGPMTVVMAAVITQFSGDFALAFTVVLLAGVFQIIFGLAGFGRYIKLVPHPVVSGFMTGIGLIVIILQLAPLLGYVTPEGSTVVKLAAIPQMLAEPNVDALALGLLGFSIVVFTPKAIGRVLPTPLLAIFLGTLAGVFLLPDAPVIGDIPSGLPSVHLPVLNLEDLPVILQFSITLAFLGSVDSLLTSLVADSMTRTHHDSNRELIGQGIGNTVAGFFGGIAGSGATMRTLVNIRAGGTTRLSGAFHAIVLAVLVLAFADLAGRIPLSVLGGILFKVGIDIIDWRNVKRVAKMPARGALIMVTTLSLTVFVDLMVAVAVGIVMAAVSFAAKMAEEQMQSMRFSFGAGSDMQLDDDELAILEAAGGRIVLLQMVGPLSFASIRDVTRQIQRTPQQEVLVIDLSLVPFIDSSAALALEEAAEIMQENNSRLVIFGASEKVMKTLSRTDLPSYLNTKGIRPTRPEALLAARSLLG